MSDRLVYSDLIRAFTLWRDEAVTHGVDCEDWVLVRNPTWRVMDRLEGSYRALGFREFPEGGFVGASMREAYECLLNLRRGMVMARKARERKLNG